MTSKFYTFLSVFSFLCFAGVSSPAIFSPDTSKLEITVDADSVGAANIHTPLKVFFAKGEEVICESGRARLIYRQVGKDTFKFCPVKMSSPHAALYNPFDSLYYVTSSKTNQVIAFRSLADSTTYKKASSIALIPLDYPHYIVQDPVDGWLYVLNPNNKYVLRMKGIGKEEGRLLYSFPEGYSCYSRALTFANGKLYIVATSLGMVLEVNDFANKKYTIYKSPGKSVNAVAGSWETTGLVINDIEYYNGYWYASNYFCPSYAPTAQNINKNKLIRFKTWQDFSAGKWEDISYLLPDNLVPYFLTVYENYLYLSAFVEEGRGKFDRVFKIREKSLGLNDLNPDRFLRIYPNPAKDLLYICVNYNAGNASLEMLDIAGQVVYSENIPVSKSHNIQVNTSSLSGGIYFVNIKSAEHITQQKVVIF